MQWRPHQFLQLASLWDAAKLAATDALKTLSHHAAERIAALKAEILALDCKPFGIRIGAERAALSGELAISVAA